MRTRLATDRRGNFYVLIQLAENLHQTVYCKTIDIRVAASRKIGGWYTNKDFGFADGQLSVIENANDLCGQDSAKLLKICVGLIKVAEDIAGAANQIKIVTHRRVSICWRCEKKDDDGRTLCKICGREMF